MSRFAWVNGRASTAALALTLALGALAVAATLSACDESNGEPRSGAQLFVDVGCVNCHAGDGAGMKGFAPTLHGKQVHWTRASLIAYLKDPAGSAQKDPRLKAQLRGYSLPMPPVVFTNPVEYENLADFVLALP